MAHQTNRRLKPADLELMQNRIFGRVHTETDNRTHGMNHESHRITPMNKRLRDEVRKYHKVASP